jgi:23S rRNA (cytosine1962-C5)-methyltransferase
MADLTAFANRLKKNARHLGRWARRENIFCYRLYDCDVPEFPLQIDIYQTEQGVRMHLQEVDTGWQQTEEEHANFVAGVVEAMGSALGIGAAAIAFKWRFRQRVHKALDQQYQASGETGEDLVVQEGACRFIVNLKAHLDTGLFLDHRITRKMVAQRAPGKRLLNLFAYTGSFSVHAAKAGARATLSVDLSNTYCNWARRNLELNQIEALTHRIERADVLVWLEQEIARGGRYDLIVLDPPSFSNSKKMSDSFDVQRDHARLIGQCMALLDAGGELLFSNNLRSFELDEKLRADYRVDDITRRTIPEDFRDQRIHHAYLLRV